MTDDAFRWVVGAIIALIVVTELVRAWRNRT